ALRVKWCKAYARTQRWHEDVVLVDEEMCRTIEYGTWMAEQWRGRAGARTRNVTPELAEGLRAYAMEHVKREEVTCAKLVGQWSGLRARARTYLAGVRDDMRGLAEVVVDIDEDE
ncbi:hypothetical protein C8F04DRAFT_912144, partial [Mycena alexandri]